MLERGPIPLYYQLAWDLRRQIQSGAYPVGALLPTEEQLVSRHGVSRTTVRLAFQVLLRDGLVIRRAGRGTFVARDPGQHPAEWVAGTLDAIILSAHELRYEFRYLRIRDVPAGPAVARSLGVARGAPVREYRRLHLVDGVPTTHVVLHVPRELAARVPRGRLRTTPVVTLLEQHCGIRIVAAHQWVAAAAADPEVARHLDIRPGAPVLAVERHFLDETGRVVELATDRYRTDRVRYYLRLERRSPRDLGLPAVAPDGPAAGAVAAPAPASATPGPRPSRAAARARAVPGRRP
jgi:GntR family transcriptional regulator